MHMSCHFPPLGSKKFMSNYGIWRSVIVVAILLSTYMSLSGVSRAEEAPSGEPVATVKIRQVQVAFIGSGALGGGTLNYQGKSYRITVGGLESVVLEPLSLLLLETYTGLRDVKI